MRISELSAKTPVSVHRLRRYEADGLIDNQLMSEQKALRQKLMDHIGWFKTQARRKK